MNLYEPVTGAAAVHPDRLAVAGPTGELTYGELDAGADALAHRMRALGVRRGDRVVIWCGKSAEAVVAMQAVLRLGAAYVPADESAPALRVAVMARDCAARVVCGTGARPDQASAVIGPGVRCLDIGETLGEATLGSAPVREPVAPDDLAYILYTSGSTGTPKGVCVSHRNARAFADWAAGELAAEPDDRFANHAPFTFDLSVLDLYAAFVAGASVHLVPGELAYAPVQLTEFLHRERISVWYSVPSALTLMMRDGGMLDRPAPPALRAVLFAGETFPIADVRRLKAWTGARLVNLYGPTETNVCTARRVTPADVERDRPVPIGVAACGDSVWVERPDGAAARPGDEGEIVVDGPTVMLGYWGRAPRRGPYRTGDLARVLPDGSLDYLGRRDHMVKVRGHRIEPGEVEAVLGGHPGVAEAAVAVAGSGVDARLVAYVVAGRGRTPGVLSLKRHSAERLPRYMIVDEVRVVPELPRTANGKVDRAALAAYGGVPREAGRQTAL